MPHRLDAHRVKVQFVTFTKMPYLIYLACLKTETVSQTRYIQEAICARLARDLEMSEADLLDDLPEPRSRAKHLGLHQPIHLRRDGGTFRIGPSGGHEFIKGE